VFECFALRTIILASVYLTTLFQKLTLYIVEWKGHNSMMSWKGFGRKRLCPAFAWGTEKNHENVGQDSRSPSRDLYPGPPEYEAIVLTRVQYLLPCRFLIN
jgi:hypothetical protein